MSVVVKPARYKGLGPDFESVDTDEYRPTLPGDYLGIECEVINPKGWKGRKVYLFLDSDDVTWLLKELRDEARRLRSQSLPS